MCAFEPQRVIETIGVAQIEGKSCGDQLKYNALVR